MEPICQVKYCDLYAGGIYYTLYTAVGDHVS
jgi:hypothetical protein